MKKHSIALCLLILNCSQLSKTQELLDTQFLKGAQIELIQPLSNASTTAQPTFIWNKTFAIQSYILRIADNPGMNNLILEKTVNDTQYSLTNSGTVLQPAAYYWQVFSNSNPPLKSSVAIFYPLAVNAVYVANTLGNSVQNGNKSAPFKFIQSGIENAKQRGASAVYVAGGTYAEEITIRPGISVYGGYSATDWSRNLTQNISILQSPNDTAVHGGSDLTAGVKSSTILDGMTINVTGTGNLTGVVLNNANMIIRNNTLNVTNTETTVSRITYGIRADNSAVDILNNKLTVSSTAGGTYPEQYTIYEYGSANLIRNNIISVTGPTYSTVGLNSHTCTSQVTNNAFRVYFGNSTNSDNAAARFDSLTSTYLFKNNTVVYSNAAAEGACTVFFPTGHPDFENNICLSVSSGGVIRHGLWAFSAVSKATILANNLVFNVPDAIYFVYPGTSINDTGSDGILNGAPNNELDTIGVCGNATCSYGNKTTAGGTAAVFNAGFDNTNALTWTIKASGPADINAPGGGWSVGDIGADTSVLGPQ